MRKREPGLVDDPVPVEEQVEVDRTRPPARSRPDAAQTLLDLEEELEERPRPDLRLELDRAVQVGRLLDGPHGSVSRSVETATTSTPSASPRSVDARRIESSRSPRFAPSPT